MNRRPLALVLGTLAVLGALAAPASAQQAKEATKEVTDGFFDVPARDPGDESQPWGLPAYLVTSTLGAAAVFVTCKSARRG